MKTKRGASTPLHQIKMVRPERFELPTTWFVARYSIQLSYGRTEKLVMPCFDAGASKRRSKRRNYSDSARMRQPFSQNFFISDSGTPPVKAVIAGDRRQAFAPCPRDRITRPATRDSARPDHQPCPPALPRRFSAAVAAASSHPGRSCSSPPAGRAGARP